MNFFERQSIPSDYEFLFTLKKSAEFDAVKAVFGWDEQAQRDIHEAEWKEAQPTIIEVSGEPAGSYLFQELSEHFYFGRFFLLSKYHGLGVGSQILEKLVTEADMRQKPIKLCYLQGNRAASLYEKFGFKRISEDSNFVYMLRENKCL
jgi:GNAT superfamily N-acetyltransferase